MRPDIATGLHEHKSADHDSIVDGLIDLGVSEALARQARLLHPSDADAAANFALGRMAADTGLVDGTYATVSSSQQPESRASADDLDRMEGGGSAGTLDPESKEPPSLGVVGHGTSPLRTSGHSSSTGGDSPGNKAPASVTAPGVSKGRVEDGLGTNASSSSFSSSSASASSSHHVPLPVCRCLGLPSKRQKRGARPKTRGHLMQRRAFAALVGAVHALQNNFTSDFGS